MADSAGVGGLLLSATGSSHQRINAGVLLPIDSLVTDRDGKKVERQRKRRLAASLSTNKIASTRTMRSVSKRLV